VWLEQSIRHCPVYSNIRWHVRTHLWLGQAKEQKGDKAGACAAYCVALDSWGKAKPRSVTADQAPARAKALGCER
jgi:serine/threonine-protein kinase